MVPVFFCACKRDSAGALSPILGFVRMNAEDYFTS